MPQPPARPATAFMGVGLADGVLEHTLLQTLVPDGMLSRVYSIDMVGSYVAFPVAFTGAGILADHLGRGRVLITGGIGLAVVCLTGLVQRSLWRLDGPAT